MFIDNIIGLFVALLCATLGTEFEAAFAAVIATIYEIDNGYVAALAAQTIDIIICGIGRIFEGYVGYFDNVLERGIGLVFFGIFSVLLAPAGAGFSTIIKSVCGLLYPPNVDTTTVGIDIFLNFVYGFEGEEGLFGNCWEFGATTVVARQVERIEFGAPVGAIIATINKYDNRIDNVFVDHQEVDNNKRRI